MQNTRSGFSLMEVMVGSVILVAIVYALSTLLTDANRGSLSIGRQSDYGSQLNSLNLALSNASICVPMLSSVVVNAGPTPAAPFAFNELLAGNVQLFRTAATAGDGFTSETIELGIDTTIAPTPMTYVDVLTGAASELQVYMGVLHLVNNLEMETSTKRTLRDIRLPVEMGFDQTAGGGGALRYCSSANSIANTTYPSKICNPGEFVNVITPNLIDCAAPVVVAAPDCRTIKLACTEQDPPAGYSITKKIRIHGRDNFNDAGMLTSFACGAWLACDFVSGRWQGRAKAGSHFGHKAICSDARPTDGLEVEICRTTP